MNNLTKGAIALSVLTILGGGIMAASAATTTTDQTDKADRGRGHGPAKMAELTDAQKAEMKAKFDAVKTALESGDYNAWVTAQKAVDENCPLLSKITADNFSKYVEASKLRNQADSIMKDLGIDQPGMGGFGPGGHHGERNLEK